VEAVRLDRRRQEVSAQPGAPFLALRDVTISFGGIAALANVTFDVAPGTVTGLIGPNGAGKTTCFNCITGFYRPSAGSIALRGVDVLRLAPHRMSTLRVARTFQNLELFRRMSVLDNVVVGAQARGRAPEAALRREALDALDYVGLAALRDRPVHELPFGVRKSVELARALATKPDLLLLDEPAAGLAHDDIERLALRIRQIRSDFNTTVLMVEHHMQLVMSVSDRIVVLSAGRKLAEGTPAEVRADPAVVEAYLGSS
jgi:branched-chain amino acid transport system ATP-binding protein